jgi:sucrose-6-phosphate hydrolase SacC (GH32 family)
VKSRGREAALRFSTKDKNMKMDFDCGRRFGGRAAHCMALRAAMLVCAVVLAMTSVVAAQSRTMAITKRYLNVPVGRSAQMRIFAISVDGAKKREFPVQLATDAVDYWIFVDVSEFKGETITLSGPASTEALNRIYQDDRIEGWKTLYKEPNRPQFHFTVMRGWNNDVNGPIYYKGQYHLFWQAFPFGVKWDTDFMYWGHAVSSDLVHWKELPAALMVDKNGSPWSGTSFVDHNNDGGWGKDALVLVYASFDRFTHKQVQCLAYSTDNGATFTHYAGNPVLDTDSELGTTDTRDPKVFWYAPGKHWVMVLFEKDGMSFFTSTDLKRWTRRSHFKGLWECPDFFAMPLDGDRSRMKWVLHGGSSTYYVGSFDGSTFTAETPALRYAEGKNAHGDDALYAAESFVDMPDGRRVQMAWGRINEKDMPFNQMILFPTEFRLVSTPEGPRLRVTPVKEVELLHGRLHAWSGLSGAEAERRLSTIKAGPLHVKMQVTLEKDDALAIRYQGNVLATVKAEELESGRGPVELLIDKSVAEIFVNGGSRYIVKELAASNDERGVELSVGDAASRIDRLEVYEMKSMWGTR